MTGELNSKSKISEIKKWYDQNIEILPNTLDSECKYYIDLKFTIESYFHQINSEIDRLGIENIKRSVIAISAKRNLYTMYLDLQNIENWNAPRPTMNLLNQRI